MDSYKINKLTSVNSVNAATNLKLHKLFEKFLSASAIGTCLVLAIGSTANAGNLYFGEDAPNTGTNFAREAELNFLSNFNEVYTEDFEGFTTGMTSPVDNPLMLQLGSNQAQLIGGGAVRDAEFNGLHSVSGDKYWSLTFAEKVQDTYTIAFDTAQSAVGFYATDMGDAGSNNFGVKFYFEDGTTSIENIAHTQNTQANAYKLFFGYVNTDLAFNKIEFLSDGPIRKDGFALDDLTIGRSDQLKASVPEPASTLGLFGVAALGLVLRNKRQVS